MRLSLGPVTLDTDRRQVFRDSEPLRVSAKAFQLLELLVENRPRALSKDELQTALWPETFVSDTSLTTLVNELRAELGESAKEPRLIMLAGERATLEDLGSKNGTFAGEKRVEEPTTLNDGDTLRLGLVTLVFRAATSDESTRTAAQP